MSNDSFMAAITSANQWGLEEVIASSQEIVRHITPRKTKTFCFYTLVFIQIRQSQAKCPPFMLS